jgi:peptidoglycan/xylan/chitin deacetylase (PgdA/CDA1 family)
METRAGVNAVLMKLARVISEEVRFRRPVSDLSIRALRGNVTVLVYHRIADVGTDSWMESRGVPFTSPNAFRKQLQELQRLGARFFTLDEIELGAWPSKDEIGIVLTFDDGFRDNFELAVEILNEFNLHAVFFVLGSIPGCKRLLWEHLLYFLAADSANLQRLNAQVSLAVSRSIPSESTVDFIRTMLPVAAADEILAPFADNAAALEVAPTIYPTWEQVQAAARGGHQIAAHTLTHRPRWTLTTLEFETEITESKRILEENLQRPITAMSYPFNSYFIGDEDRCAAAGYSQVATVDPGRLLRSTSAYWVPRRCVSRSHDSIVRFRALLGREGF